MTHNTTLTTLEEDVMEDIVKNDFYDLVGDQVWSDCLHDSCQKCEKNQISGVVSSLVKKGMVKVHNKGTSAAAVEYTPAGLKYVEVLVQ